MIAETVPARISAPSTQRTEPDNQAVTSTTPEPWPLPVLIALLPSVRRTCGVRAGVGRPSSTGVRERRPSRRCRSVFGRVMHQSAAVAPCGHGKAPAVDSTAGVLGWVGLGQVEGPVLDPACE